MPVQKIYLKIVDPFKRLAIALTVVSILGVNAYAEDADLEAPDPQMFSFRGFGTLGAVHSNQHQADFVGNFFQPKGAGHSRPWAVSVDSKLGAQMDAKFSDTLSAVIQVVSKYNYDSTYTPQVEWINLKYQVTPNFDLRIGRFVASTFLFSDVSLVGYTYPWVRPPQELYTLAPFTNKDGIDASYQFRLGDWVDTLHASYGTASPKIPGGGEAIAKRYLDVQNRVEYGPTTFRIGYTAVGSASFQTPNLDALFDGFVQFGNAVPGPAGQQALLIAHQRRTVDSPYTIFTVGAVHDPGDWLLMGEWAKVITRNPIFVSDSTAWYVTAGKRIAAFTPFVTLAQIRPHKLNITPIPTAGLPSGAPGPLEIAGALNGGIAAVVNGFAFSQDSVTAGVRWDFHKDMDMKLQYEHLRTGSGSSGRLNNPQPGFRSGDSADVFSIAVDFVF